MIDVSPTGEELITCMIGISLTGEEFIQFSIFNFQFSWNFLLTFMMLIV